MPQLSLAVKSANTLRRQLRVLPVRGLAVKQVRLLELWLVQ
jgi:hypothetical protein